MSARSIIQRALKERPYFGESGGITISGGEPTLQARELITLFRMARKEGIHTALDTNGGVVSTEVQKLYDLTDLVILDVKHIDEEAHRLLTGMPNMPTLENAAYRERSGKPMWLRYVLVPGHNDSDEVLHRWGAQFSTYQTVERVEILPYHTLGAYKYAELGRENPLEGVLPPTPESVRRAREVLEQYFKTVVVH
jgi:pyruvate formate lyase activating enzyme